MLYDADKIKDAASVKDEQDLYQAQCDIFLNPHDPEIIAQAKKDGVPDSWITAAQNSPVYKMAMEWKVALPLHPEYRTLPMVWYIPPLSPITNAAEKGQIEMDGVIPDVHKLRIPVKYLANLLTAGKEEPVVNALEKMIAMREYMREKNVEGFDNPELLKQVGLDEATLTDMYRIMALANYEDRFVIPTNHREYSGATPFDNEIGFDTRSSCGFSFGNGCSGDVGKTSLFGTKTHKNTMSGKVPKTSKKSRLGKFGD
jgi:nitrate reductase beta subunit